MRVRREKRKRRRRESEGPEGIAILALFIEWRRRRSV
jgi:hypothetical protein